MLTHIINSNELSSDYNPMMLDIYSTPITSFPPISNIFINWKKYNEKLIEDVNSIISSLVNIKKKSLRLASATHTDYIHFLSQYS